ncbi:MAG TPA: PepSY-associated TM helix domain-containing protein [Gemmatimonadaceae bacterium]
MTIRQLHFYVGLYFLLFIWLFSISGLFLNHPKWEFTRFWPQRDEASSGHAIETPLATGDIAMARELMTQLAIAGELDEVRRTADTDRLAFRVVRPGLAVNVEAALATGRATVTETRVNTYGLLDALHQFTGVAMDAPQKERDWLLTRIWSVAMDALAIGLIGMVASGVYLGYRLRRKRRMGMIVFAAGTTCCAFFVFGLALMY